LPKGIGIGVMKKLKEERDIITSNVDSARGMGKLTPHKYRGAGEQTEKEILNVVVNKESADDLFEYIYEIAEINRPHGGMIYMSRLQESSTYTLPDIPDKK